MIWTRLKALFTKRPNASAGSFPPPTAKVSACYAELDHKHRWQGDVYPKLAFPQKTLPTPEVPYWMLINRTCHLYEGEGRYLKFPYLNFVAVYPLHEYVSNRNDPKSIENQVNEIIKKGESVIFLPVLENSGIDTPLVANFNLLFTLRADMAPSASEKRLQLSSPFCEYTFQKFSRFFYTVGYDDEQIKSKTYISSLVDYVRTKLKTGK